MSTFAATPMHLRYITDNSPLIRRSNKIMDV